MGPQAPPPVAHGEPELAVVSAKRNETFRGAGECGDLRRREEGENAELDVFGEVGEGNGTTRVFKARHFCLSRLGRIFSGKLWIF